MEVDKTIYIVGHTNPDTDSIASAIALSRFIPNALPVRLGPLNPETKYLLSILNMHSPGVLEDLTGKNLFLVDHSERTQSIESIDRSNVLGIIDHHKIGFTTSVPIIYVCKPVGCTATIIAELYFSNCLHFIGGEDRCKLDDETATLLISAILSDTLFFRSPTTTDLDRKMVEKLLKHTELIHNLELYAMDLLRARSNFKGMTAEEIFNSGAKDFIINENKICISQLEVVDPKVLDENIEHIKSFAEKKVNTGNFDISIFVVTDILNNSSEVYAFGKILDVEKAFNYKMLNNKAVIPNLISRKKQIVPALEKHFGV